MGKLVRAGVFAAAVKEGAMATSDRSQSVSWTAKLDVHHERTFDGRWIETPERPEIFGSVYVVDSKGGVLKNGVTTLCELGWDGDPESINKTTLLPGTEVVIEVEMEDYQGKLTAKVQWFHPQSWGGSTIQRAMDGDGLRALSAKFGSQFRAFALPPRAKPAGAPDAPPPPNTATPAPSAGETVAAFLDGEGRPMETPFG